MSRVIPDTTLSTLELARSLGLSTEEYQYVCKKLERKPNFAELGIFSAMFSEHCSYKSSKKYLKRFPTTGKRVLQGPGENAGILDIGHGWAVAFKMESHNHPSFIEPYQGAATGVGGILRDIFTMGARPIASMDALCFGSLDFPRTASIIRGVVKGVGDYGNCIGVPTVAGQTLFHPCYTLNPLLNAFSMGIVRTDKIFRGYASGIGNCLVYVGAKTGRDGVHGATMASKEFSSDKELERPTVQVGDPFTEKLLLEATLEAMSQGLMIGIQDMGAAGLTSSSFEMCHRAKSGLEVDLDKVPTREKGMTGYELLLSESQERMLLVCLPSQFDALRAVYSKWDLHADVIGQVTEGRRVKMTKDGEVVVDLPVDIVAEPILAERPMIVPGDLKQRWFMDRNRMLIAPLEAKFQALVEDINFGSPAPLVMQYDSMVGNRTEGGVFDDVAVIKVREITESRVRLALKADCNPRVGWLSPREGGRRAVAESALNLATCGAEPIGITDCLNFGSPENPEVMWQLAESIEGISETCEKLRIPVISGNVSLYNDTDGKPIHPTPMIGMVGLIEDDLPLPKTSLFSTELEIGLVGLKEGGLGGSLLSAAWFKRDCGKPDDTDLGALERVMKFCQQLRQKLKNPRFQYAIHDISEGGIVLTALEMAFLSKYECAGIEINIPFGLDPDRFLFGEAVPRVLVAYDPSERVEMEALSGRCGVSFMPIGQTNDQATFKILQGGAVSYQTDLTNIRSKWKDRWKGFFQ